MSSKTKFVRKSNEFDCMLTIKLEDTFKNCKFVRQLNVFDVISSLIWLIDKSSMSRVREYVHKFDGNLFRLEFFMTKPVIDDNCGWVVVSGKTKLKLF